MRTGKKGFRRIAAMICALALCASMLPTAAFAEGDQDAGTGTDISTSASQSDENSASDSGNTQTEDTTKTEDEKSNGSEVDSTTTEDDGEKATTGTEGTGDSETTGSTEGAGSGDENGTVVTDEENKPADTPDEDNNAGLAATYSANGPAAAPKGASDGAKVVGGKTQESEDSIFTVEYYEGISSDLKSDLTVIAVDENGDMIDQVALGKVYRSSWTMSITINDAYKTVYELEKVIGEDGVSILDWSGDFNDAQNTTFTWSDIGGGKATIYLHLKTASHVLELKNSEKGVDLGTITWKEGGKQLTTVKVYLNYDLVYTSEPLAISNALNNFVLDLKDGYYFNTVTMEGIQYTSSIDEQTFTYNSVGNYNRLVFGAVPSIYDGTNTVSLYVFNYEDGVKVKYDRYVNNGITNVNAACPSLDIAYTVNGYNTQFTYTDLDSDIYLPKYTKVTTTANVQDGYYFEYWQTADAAVDKNNLYTIGADGNPILQYTGPLEGQIGHVAFSQSMMAEYSAAFTSGRINLYMTDGDRPVIDYNDYRITYCPNGENVTPADNQVQYFYRSSQGTYGTSIRGCMFTRDGYEFLGWNTDPDGKGTAYAPDAIYGDDMGENDLTLYAQWKKIDEPETKPNKPSDPTVKELLKDRVLVQCVNTAATHSETSKPYGVLEGGYTVGEVQGDATSGYTVDVTIQSARYVTQYNTDTNSKHVLADGEQNTQTFTLQYNGTDGEWTVKGPEQVTVKVTCDDGSTTPTEPPLPDEEDLQKLLNEAVTVKCTNGDNAHNPMDETYSVLKEGYTLGTLQGDEKSGYTVDVTLLNSAYLAAFNEKTGVKHELDPETQENPVITLRYVTDSKEWKVETETPAIITVTCKVEMPTVPDEEDLQKLLNEAVTVKCTNGDNAHDPMYETYGVLEDGYTVSDLKGNVEDGFTVDVTLLNSAYLAAFNDKTGVKHELDPETQENPVITLGYVTDSKEWKVETKTPVIITVTCKVEMPTVPGEEDLQKLLNEAVTVKCTNGDNAHDPMYETYGVLEGGYTVSDLKGNVENGFTVDVTLLNSAYLAAFNDKTGIKHVLDPETQENPVITLGYVTDSKEWKVETKTPVIITVTCKDAVDADIVITPEDLTIYRGGEKTAETGSNVNIVDGNGNPKGNDGSLPEIGFSLKLSDELNQRLCDNLGAGDDEVLNLSAYITLTGKTTDGQTLTWKLAPYGEGTSATNTETGYYIYKIVPTSISEGAKLNVSFLDNDGNYVGTDAFEIEDDNNLAATYKMMIYGDRVDASSLYATITYSDGKTETVSVQGAEKPATLTVRYTNTDASITHSFDTVAEASKSEDQNDQSKLTQSAYMIRKDAEEKPVDSFMVNNSDVQVDDQNVSLLFDDIAETTGTHYADTLKTKAVEAVKANNAGVDTSKLKTEAKYLDLVDATNGNVWVTTDDDVTIYWPFPKGTDASTTFYVAHFDGLDRDKDVATMTGEVNGATATLMDVETDQYGVYFTTKKFSPYVLVWDTTKTQPTTPDDDNDDDNNNDNNNATTTTNNNTSTTNVSVNNSAAASAPAAAAVIPQTGDAMPVGLLGGVAVIAAAAFAALFVLRKRKHND